MVKRFWCKYCTYCNQ